MARHVTIVHFNDVYNIEPGKVEPVGGAARFVEKVKTLKAKHPLVLFSGDCYNPSLLSTMTHGQQMVPILNSLGVQAACLGNHDLDFGVSNFEALSGKCNFPWLLANVMDKHTGEPVAGVKRSVLLDWQGVKVGIVGLAEPDWVETLPMLEPEDITYLDFVVEGRRLAQQLRSQGAELLIALSHMREVNDRLLAAEAPEFDLVLGGHDHHYVVSVIAPHANLMVKSGTDFREFTEIRVTLPPRQEAVADATPVPAAVDGAGGGEPHARAGPDAGQQLAPRLPISWQRHEVDSSTPEDADTAASVAEFAAVMGARMDEVVAATLEPLDGRFVAVRLAESNLGNFVSDAFLRGLRVRGQDGATGCVDAVLLNSGTFRSDVIHPAGPLTFRDLMSVLPMLDETVVIGVTGAQLLEALENGVSAYPKLEGRFPQVAGIRFAFDPRNPEGQRIDAASVSVGGAPLDLQRSYCLATKLYIAQGKDGYDVLADCPEVLGPECCPTVPTVMRNFFSTLAVLNLLDPKVKARAAANKWAASRSAALGGGGGDAAAAGANGADGAGEALQQGGGDVNSKLRWHQHRMAAAGHVAVHPETGAYVIAPRTDGRIHNLAEGEVVSA